MTAQPAPQLRLSLNLSGVGRHAGSWRAPQSDPADTLKIDHFVKVAQIAERGLFDSVFLADGPIQGTDPGSIPYRFEPLELLTTVAVETSNIGLIGTLSTSYNDPYSVAERASSLDHISAGRAAVNAVASAGNTVANNFGLAVQPDHSTRYERLGEFLALLRATWLGEPAAPARFFEAYDGRRTAPSAQGGPLIVQAGGSAAGRDAAARGADMVYAGSSSLANAQSFYADVRRRTIAAGRSADSIKILPGAVPYVASTEREAHELEAELDAYHQEGVDVIAQLGGIVGLDLSDVDPDAPFPLADLPPDNDLVGGVSLASLASTLASDLGLTTRQLAERLHNGGFGNIQWKVVGTPEQVADEFQHWFEQGTGDGFNLMIPIQPSGLEVFVDEVVPLLQRRGLFRTSYESATLRENLGLAQR